MVARPRLYHLLDRWQEYRCIYVHGSAGYGKSVLVSAWVEQDALTDSACSSTRTAWLSLDESDCDPIPWLWYVAAALEQLQPGLMTLIAPLLNDAGAPAEKCLGHLLASLDPDRQDPCLFVLDDYHRVESPTIDVLMVTLLERAPAWLHFVLISRRATAMPLNRLIASGQVLEIDREALRFRQDELAVYLAEWGLGDLPEETVAQLLARTEGWIAALQLASHGALQDTDADALFAQLQGEQGWLARYLTDELLARQPPARRRFLLMTSILARFNAALATAVTEDSDTYRLLDEVRTADLFLIPLDRGGEWFRYHHLFQDLLQHRLHADFTSETIGLLHRRAAVWLAQADEIGEALEHLLAIPDMGAAVDLVVAHARPALVRGDSHRLERWLAQLPEEAVATSLPLLLARGLLSFLSDNPEILTHVQNAETVLAATPDATERERVELLVLRTIGHYLQRDLVAMGDAAYRAYSQVEYLDDFMQGTLHFSLMHYTSQRGNLAQALEHGIEAADAYGRAGFSTGVIAVRRETAVLAMWAGSSEVATRQFEELAASVRDDRSSYLRELGLAEILAARHYYWLNRLQRAAHHQQAALVIMHQLQDRGFVAEAQCLGQLLQATSPALQLTTETFAPDDLAAHGEQFTTPMLYWIRLFMRRGESAEAWLRVADWAVPTQPGMPGHDLMRQATVLNVLTMQGDDSTSVASEYEQALDEVGGEERRFHRLLLMSLFAWYQLHRGKRKAAAHALDEALDLADSTGYIRMILDLRELMPLLAASSHPLAAPLLQQMEREQMQQHGIELTLQELAVLELLEQDYKYREIAEHLVVSLNTVRFHVRNIYAKLGVKRRAQAIAAAQARDLLPGASAPLNKSAAA